MTELQILDVDYILVNEKPIIRIFGKTIEGESVCCFYEGYMPYFYFEDERGLKILEKDPQIIDIKETERMVIGDQEPRKFFKVTIKNPAKTPEFREMLKTSGIKTYESDILFKYRFMNDIAINGMDWIVVSDETIAATNTIKASKKLDVKKIKSLIKEEDAPLKLMAFDIECCSPKNIMPDAKKDPVILISVVFSDEYKGKKSLVLSTRSDQYVLGFESEKEMLEEFMKIIDEYDPDILTGYNINGFDIPYLLERMRQNNIRPLLGRCKQKSVMSKKFGGKNKTYIVGRIIVDSFDIIKKDFALQRYGLDFVSEKLLKQKKEPVKKSEINRLWKGDLEGFRRLVSYCRKDSILALNLVLRLNLVDKYMALSKVSGTLLQDTLDGGESTRIENYVLREFNKHDYVFPNRPSSGRISERIESGLGGGEVLKPERGLHSSVLVFDFKAMYPSIIKTFNICPTTKISKEAPKCIKTPSGAMFLNKEVKEGIIPKIVNELMTQRQTIKKRLKRTKNPEKKKLLYANQWALKIMANAMYGYFGYARSRLFDLDIANAITSTGRNIIINTKNIIEDKFKYRVVYGDTDSVFVKIPDNEKDNVTKIGERISAYITNELPGSVELEFEKFFKRFLPLTKKRYVAWSFTPSEGGWEENIEMKGIETVRRDWCDLVGSTMKDILEIILKKNDVSESVKYFKGVIEKLLKNEIPIQSLVITKTMTKQPKSYAGVQPHIELVKKLQARNPAEMPGVGDGIGYVIVKGTQMLSKRAEDPIYIVEKGLQVDSHYYIENQLLPPLERIFTGLGISKSELLGNGKQIGILDAIRMNSDPGAKTALLTTKPKRLGEEKQEKQAILDDFNGFICSKCNNFYPRIPLIGTCKCGGSLLFSTSHGPKEWLNT